MNQGIKRLGWLIVVFCSIHLMGTGSYSVPAEGELSQSAKWGLDLGEWKIQEGELFVDYALPTDLVGTELSPLSFKGKIVGDYVHVSGKFVIGTCMLTEGPVAMTCLLKYPGMPFDLESRNEELEKHFEGLELKRRIEVADLFHADPAGILVLPKRPE